ncbi:MAG: aminotransferase class IV [Bryobacterales bacterium]|nr:aminotransferase class IV [Bryobacterales bacterium]
MHRNFLHQDRILPQTEKTLSAGQVGLMNGWGVFSTLRAEKGVLFEYGRHWARMTRDAKAMGVPMPCGEKDLEERLHRLMDANDAPDATVRVVVVRNRGGMWEGSGIDRDSDLIAFTAPLKPWKDGIAVGVQPHARYAAGEFAGAKVLSWAMNLRWLERAQEKGYDEVLLLNEHDAVAECTSANVFAKFDRQVLTPPLSAGCLPGVTRQLLLDTIHVDGYHVREESLTVADLYRADVCFITSSTRDVRAIGSIEGEALQQDAAFIAAFQQAFGEYLALYVAQHKRGPRP